VIDALNECEREDDIRTILQLVAKAKDLDTTQLRIFITSRPEIPIRFRFRALSENVHQNFVLHNISPVIIEHDISIFIRDELKKIKERRILTPECPLRLNTISKSDIPSVVTAQIALILRTQAKRLGDYS
jgi:hypothetical protein